MATRPPKKTRELPSTPGYSIPGRNNDGVDSTVTDEPQDVPATAPPPTDTPYPDEPKKPVRPLKPKFQKKITDQADPEGDDQSAETEQQMARRAIMEGRVDQRIKEAISARTNSGIEEIWRESNELYEGIDELNNYGKFLKVASNAPARATPQNGQSRVILNITQAKTDIAVSRVQEMLVPNDDKAFAIEPTPLPELEKDAAKTPTVTLADGTQAPTAVLVAKMKDEAQQAATNEEEWVDDQFVEGDGKGGTVYLEMRKVIADAGRIGSGVLKGPIIIADTKKDWVLDRKSGQMALVESIRQRPTSKKIRAEDLFPAGDCGDNIHNGSYCVERDYLTGRQLRDLADLEEYDRKAIGLALVEGPTIHAKSRAATYGRKQGDTGYDSSLFEVWYYYGDVDPEDLTAMSMVPDDITAEERALLAIPAIVTMVNGRAIKAIVNPNEKGCFPYDVFNWDKVDGQVFGRGVPWKGRAAQRSLTASFRKMMENGGLSAGPQVVVQRSAITPWDNNYAVEGRKGWYFDADEFVNDVNKAFAVFNIPSMQEELMNIVKFALEMFDQLLNLPLLMQGIAQPGTAPETLGGMKMLYANSTSPLRTTARQFDDQLIVPHLGRYHDFCMSYGPANCKGDNKIKARGASVLVKLEEAKEFLAQLYQVKDDPAFKINPEKYAVAMAKANGFSLQTIQYTDDEWKKVQADKAKQPPPADPAMEVAKVRAQAIVDSTNAKIKGDQTLEQMKMSEGEKDRQNALAIENIQLQIAEMELAGKENISLTQVKAMLADQSMKQRGAQEELRVKLKTGSGI